MNAPNLKVTKAIHRTIRFSLRELKHNAVKNK